MVVPSPDRTTPEHKSEGINSPTDVKSYHPSTDIMPHHYEEYDDDNDDDNDDDDDDIEEGDDEDLGFDSTLLDRLGDLPIVREGSALSGEVDNMILMNGGIAAAGASSAGAGGGVDVGLSSSDYEMDDEEGYDDVAEYDNHDDVRNQYLEYQREQEELQKEMNLNKIAFAAYRSAVLHLVHNQASFGKSQRSNRGDENKDSHNREEGEEEEEEEEGGGGGGGSITKSKSNDTDVDTVNTEEDANHRMTILEEMAKEIVETKARACFDAILIAKEFELRRQERKQRQTLLVGGFASMGSQESVLSELRKMKKKADDKVNKDESPKQEKEIKQNHDKDITAAVNSTVKKTVTSKPVPIKNKGAAPVQVKMQVTPPGPIVPLKKRATQHEDCIKSTLPKFLFEMDNDEDNSSNNISRPTPASYRTTKWITNMVKWRIQRLKHKQSICEKCGCPECLKELHSLKQ